MSRFVLCYDESIARSIEKIAKLKIFLLTRFGLNPGAPIVPKLCSNANKADHCVLHIHGSPKDKNFDDSLDNTVTNLIIDLVSITKIELDAFSGSFENERLSILSRILSLESRTGVSRKQGHRILCEVRTNMNPDKRFGEIVRHAFPEPLLSLLRSYTGGPLRFEGLVYKSRACEYLIVGCKVIVWFPRVFESPQSMPYSERKSREDLLLRKACEFRMDAQIRYSGEEVDDGFQHRLERRLNAFHRMIEDIASSQRPVRELEEIAARLDEEIYENSLDETLTNLGIDLVAISKTDLMAYPDIFADKKQWILARVMRLACRIGIPRYQLTEVLRELEENANAEERLGKIERKFEFFLKSPDPAVAKEFLRMLGLPSALNKIEDFKTLIFESGIFYMPHYMSDSMTNFWESTKQEFYRQEESHVKGLLVMKEMWDVFSCAHEALMKIPAGFVDLEAELSVFISTLSDIGMLVNNSESVNEEEINEGIIDQLEPIIPMLEGYAREAFSGLSEKRSRIVEKIYLQLSVETRIILQPLLVKFVDDYLVDLLGRDRQGLPKYSDQTKALSISFLELQVDGYIEAIHIGNASRISVYEFLREEICQADWQSYSVEDSNFGNTLRRTFEFASRFGVRTLLYRLDLFRDRSQNFRMVIAACLQMHCELFWNYLADFTDEQLNCTVQVLRILVNRRNFVLSLNEDEPAASLTSARDFIDNVFWEKVVHTSWISEHLFDPSEFSRVLGRCGFLGENIKNILSYFEFPERLILFSKRFDSLYRKLRRKIGGTKGKRLHDMLSHCIGFPSELLHLEINCGFVDAVDPEELARRDSLEAVFSDFLDLFEVSGDIILHEKAASGEIIDSLAGILFGDVYRARDKFMSYAFTRISQQSSEGVIEYYLGFSAKFKLEKEVLLNRFPGFISNTS